MDVNMNYGLRGEFSSQEDLLSDNELLTITKELPAGMLNEMGLLLEDGYKSLDMIELQPEVKPTIQCEIESTMQPVVRAQDTGVTPTCQFPCTTEWSGNYDFELMVDSTSASNKTWLYSYDLKKMFVDVNQSIPLQFKIDRKYGDKVLFVRGLALYNVTDHRHIPVDRCYNHLKEDENKGLENIHHVLQCRHKEARYEYDTSSNRFSVVVPLEHPPAGSDVTTVMYRMTCKSSCAGGMNRRPVVLIFTLETPTQEVVGRQIINIRVCSCPKRDKKKEEEEKKEEIGRRNGQPESKEKIIMKPKPSSHEVVYKKRKVMVSAPVDSAGDNQLYNIQVSGTKHYILMLKYLKLLKTDEWVENNSPEAWRMKEECEKMLEAVSKGTST